MNQPDLTTRIYDLRDKATSRFFADPEDKNADLVKELAECLTLLCDRVDRLYEYDSVTMDEQQPMTTQVNPDFEWPSWLAAEWIAMDRDGDWCAYDCEPIIEHRDGMWNVNDGDCMYLACSFIHFIPPPCTDWTQSKLRNPNR